MLGGVGRGGGGGTGVISHILEWHIQFIISSECTMWYKLGGKQSALCRPLSQAGWNKVDDSAQVLPRQLAWEDICSFKVLLSIYWCVLWVGCIHFV